MIAYSYDNDGYFIGTCRCQLDPVKTRKEGHPVYLLPKNATWDAPPQFDPETQRARWDGESWHIEDLPPAPPPGPDLEDEEV